MPANHKVSVGWQIVALLIPIANFWAFYRIRRLRKYMLLIVLPSTVMSIILLAYYLGRSPTEVSFGRSEGFSFGDPGLFLPITIIGNVVSLGLFGFSIYIIVKWSREHNQKFDSPTPPQTG